MEQLRKSAALPTLSEETVKVPPLPVLNTCFSGSFPMSVPTPVHASGHKDLC